jgi:hypothetical protein
MGSRANLDYLEKRKVFDLPRLELRAYGRPAHVNDLGNCVSLILKYKRTEAGAEVVARPDLSMPSGRD